MGADYVVLVAHLITGFIGDRFLRAIGVGFQSAGATFAGVDSLAALWASIRARVISSRTQGSVSAESACSRASVC